MPRSAKSNTGNFGIWGVAKKNKTNKTKPQPTVDLYSLMYCPFLYQLVRTLDLRELSIRGRSDAQSKEAIWWFEM